MSDSTQSLMRRLVSRVRAALFFRGVADGIAVVALALACLMLAARFLAWPLLPEPVWLGLFVAPLLWGVARASRAGLTDRTAAVYIDRRFGLKGLLLTSLDHDARAWEPALHRRLAASAATLPTLRARGLMSRALLPLALLGAVLLLPLPALAGGRSANPLIEEALADFEEKLELALEEGAVDEEQGVEMRARLKQLETGLRSDELVLWNDVDALQAKLAHEEALQQSRAQKSRAALEDFAARAQAGDAKADGKELGRLLEQAMKLGQMPELSPELLARLGAAGEAGGLDPSALPEMSPEELARLAQALADAMAGDPGQLPPGELLDPTQLEDLQRLVAGEFDPQHEHGPT